MSELDETVERMLDSKTFEPDELKDLLVKQGHDEADVVASIARVKKHLEVRGARPAEQRQAAVRRTAGRLIRAGIFVLIVGLGFSWYFGAGVLYLLLVLAAGGGLVGAGFREQRGL